MKNKAQLRLKINFDDDSTCEVKAKVSAHGFEGRGSAWFDLQTLQEFVDSLDKYPLSQGQYPSLSGGYWNSEIPGTLEQVHLLIEIYPVDQKGRLSARVILASEEGAPPKKLNQIEVEFETSYEGLRSFSRELKALLSQTSSEAILIG